MLLLSVKKEQVTRDTPSSFPPILHLMLSILLIFDRQLWLKFFSFCFLLFFLWWLRKYPFSGKVSSTLINCIIPIFFFSWMNRHILTHLVVKRLQRHQNLVSIIYVLHFLLFNALPWEVSVEKAIYRFLCYTSHTFYYVISSTMYFPSL